MRLELGEAQRRAYRCAVADDVQAAAVEVDDPPAGRILDVGVADAPLSRNFPIESGSAGGNLMDGERNVFAQDPQGLPYALAGDASTDRIEALHQRVERSRAFARPAPASMRRRLVRPSPCAAVLAHRGWRRKSATRLSWKSG